MTERRGIYRGGCFLFSLLIGVALFSIPSKTVDALVLNPNNLQGWVLWVMNPNSAQPNFVEGPLIPPEGEGSLRMRSGPGSGPNQGGKVFFGGGVLSGIPLNQLTQLRYSTFVDLSSGAASQLAPYLNLQVDLDGDGQKDTTLVFDASYQGPYPGPVVKGVWQEWDALSGKWWCTVAVTGCSVTLRPTLPAFLVNFPAAKIVDWGTVPGFSVVAGQASGGAWANFDGNADAVKIGVNWVNTLYDIEQPLNAYVDDDWSGSIYGTDPDGSDAAQVFGGDAFDRIQDAIDGVKEGGSVFINEGVFTEQVEIAKDLTLQGSGAASVVESPNLLPQFFSAYGNKNYPIVYVHDAEVALKNFLIDGAGKGNANYRFEGVGYHRAGGAVQDLEIRGLRNSPLDGMQHGVGIVAVSDDNIPRTLSIVDCNIYDFQKNGMALNGDGLSVAVTGNTVQGVGATPIIAQNGIQVSRGAGGVVGQNNVGGMICTHPTAGCLDDPISSPTADGAAGILLYHAGGTLEVKENLLNGNQFGIWSVGSEQLDIHDNILMGDETPGGANGMFYDVGIAVWDSDQWSGLFGYSETATGGIVRRNHVIGWDYGLQGRDYTPQGMVPPLEAHFNHIVQSSVLGGASDYPIDAQNNWWGCNGPLAPQPACNTVGGEMDADPWLMLGIRVQPSTIQIHQSAQVEGSLIFNSNGEDTSPLGLLPSNLIGLLFETDLGSVGSPPVILPLLNGRAAAVYQPTGGEGTATVSVALNQEKVQAFISIVGEATAPQGEPEGKTEGSGSGTTSYLMGGGCRLNSAHFSFNGFFILLLLPVLVCFFSIRFRRNQIVEAKGIEPSTFALRTRRSPS